MQATVVKYHLQLHAFEPSRQITPQIGACLVAASTIHARFPLNPMKAAVLPRITS
jgi:hypothetical protein